mgnify:CR=1 FL=1
MSEIKEYKCPACGGAMEFDSASQKMKCPYCDTEISIEDYEALEKEKETSKDNKATWDQEEMDGMAIYICQSCGGEIAADKIVLLATHVVTDVECIAKEIILLKQGRILKKASPMELIREMDGLVWEFLIQPEEMAGVQKKYLVSNIMMTDAGMLVRAVGNGEQFPAERKKAAANMEDVYLYRVTMGTGQAVF